MFVRDNIIKIMYNHKIMDNHGGNTGQLDFKIYSNLHTLIRPKMALIPKWGKLQVTGGERVD